MGFLAIMIGYTMRVCLSVAITEMVVPLNSTAKANESLICPIDQSSVQISHPTKTVSNFLWENKGFFLNFMKFCVNKRMEHDTIGVKSNKDGFYRRFLLDTWFHIFRLVLSLKNLAENGHWAWLCCLLVSVTSQLP